MRKFIAYFTLLIFCLSSFGQSFAFDEIANEKVSYGKEAISYMNELKKTKNGENYIKFVDTLVEKNKNNQAFLSEMATKLDNADTSLINNLTVSNTLNYLNAKVNIALITLNENLKSEILTINVSNDDKRKVEDKIKKLQYNLTDKLDIFAGEMIKKMNQDNNLKETGNLNIKLDIDDKEDMGKLNAKIGINNYISETYNFDSKLSGDFSLLFDYINNNEEINLEMNSVLDMISKEGTIYFLFKNLNIVNEKNTGELSKAIEKLKEFAIKEKYIKYEDAQTQNIFNIMKSFNYKNVLSDIKITLDEPFFETYKVEDKKYYLRPTKYSCDSFKKLASKFDPFNGNTCSTSQYNSVLESFDSFGKIYMSFDGDDFTTIGFEGNTDNNIEENKGFISFSDENIVEFYYSLKPNQKENPGNYLLLQYKGGNLSGSLVIDDYEYNYETDNYINTKTEINLSGKQSDISKKIDNLQIKYSSKFEDGSEYLNGIFEITKNNFIFKHKNDTFLNKTNINIDGSINPTGILTDMNINIDMSNRNFTFGNNYEVKYEDVYTKLFTSKITIDNKVISGETNIFDNGLAGIKITTSGNYTTGIFNLNNKYEVSKEMSKNMFLDNKDHNINGNFNINSDTTDNKNNFYMLFDINDLDKKIFNMEIDGKASIQKGGANPISAPKDSIDIDEAFGINTKPYLYY